MEIKNVKINGKLVDENTKLVGNHLCFHKCPLEATMSCPKTITGGNEIITKYPFIIDGEQVQVIEERYDKYSHQKEMVTETKSLIVTKCKRYEDAIKNARK